MGDDRRPARRRALLFAGVLLLVSAAPARARGELVIIAHPAVAADRLERRELERIYLGKTSRWADGVAVAPAMLKEGPVHAEFVADCLDRPVHRFVTYWRQMVFTGKGVPPAGFDREQELVAYVAATPGAVGYARPGTAAAAAGVKILPLE